MKVQENIQHSKPRKMCTCEHYRHIKGITACVYLRHGIHFFTAEELLTQSKCKDCPYYENFSIRINKGE